MKGDLPVNISNTVHPRDQISAYLSYYLSKMISGAIQLVVPMYELRHELCSFLADPKSESFTVP